MHIETARFIALQAQLLQRNEMTEQSGAKYIETKEQWEYLRPIITKLYIGDDWELENVMGEIRRMYGFKATRRMYNKRLKEWGIRKKNRRHEVEEILRLQSARNQIGKCTGFILGGQEVDMDDIERYRRRKQILITDVDATELESRISDLEIYTPPSSPSLQASPIVFTPSTSSGSDTASPRSIPKVMALPTSLAHRENFHRGVMTGFEIMMKTGYWNLSPQLERPWNPVSISEPLVSETYAQDECFRYLTNGVIQYKKGKIETAFKEWNGALALIASIVQGRHYYLLGKMLESIQYLYSRGHRQVAEVFRSYLCKKAQQLLKPAHQYYPIFCALEYLPLEDIEELQFNTQKCLVQGLEDFLGPEAFTSFEHKMVLAQRILEADPSRNIDNLMPTDEECEVTYGRTSFKTFLALNLRYCVLRSWGLLQETKQTCVRIIHRAMMVEDAPVRLWHLTSAWVNLARVQYDLGEVHDMRFSLQEAWNAETELRDEYGMIKLGEGESNWVFEKLGIEPMFRDADPVISSSDDM